MGIEEKTAIKAKQSTVVDKKYVGVTIDTKTKQYYSSRQEARRVTLVVCCADWTIGTRDAVVLHGMAVTVEPQSTLL